MDYDIEKNESWKKWFHCKTLRFLLFYYKFLNKLRKNYSKSVWKIINAIQSFNFQLYEIIIIFLVSPKMTLE